MVEPLVLDESRARPQGALLCEVYLLMVKMASSSTYSTCGGCKRKWREASNGNQYSHQGKPGQC